MTVVCPEGHKLAQVIATADGSIVEIPHNTVWVSPKPGGITRADRRGVPERVPLGSGCERFEASCLACKTDHEVSTDLLRQWITEGRRRVVVPPWQVVLPPGL